MPWPKEEAGRQESGVLGLQLWGLFVGSSFCPAAGHLGMVQVDQETQPSSLAPSLPVLCSLEVRAGPGGHQILQGEG